MQDFLINPAMTLRGPKGEPRDPAAMPPGLISNFISTSDGERLEVWSVDPKHYPVVPQGEVPIVLLHFHGNGEWVENNASNLEWFHGLGFRPYVYDFRGYGRSTGWPSEEGFYRDVDAFLEFVRAREPADAKIIVWGASLGTGLAAYAAQKISPDVLALLMPYSSLPEVVQTRPLYGPLYRFLWYTIPTSEYVSRLKDTCLIVAHGQDDSVIPIENGYRVLSSYHGSVPAKFIYDPSGNHWNTQGRQQKNLEEAMQNCLATRQRS